MTRRVGPMAVDLRPRLSTHEIVIGVVLVIWIIAGVVAVAGVAMGASIPARAGMVVDVPIVIGTDTAEPVYGAQATVTIMPAGLTLPVGATAAGDCTAAVGPLGQRTGLTWAVVCPGPRMSAGHLGTLRLYVQHRGRVRVVLTRCQRDERDVPCGPAHTIEAR